MKKRALLYATMLLLPAILFGNEGAEGSKYLAVAGREYDFVPRVFNFIIFVALTYYLIAEPIKNYFVSRKEAIASQLSEIENRLQKAKESKETAEQALEASRRKAEEILKDAEKEVKLIKEQYAEIGKKEIENLIKQFEEKKELQERKVKKELVISLLEENISVDDIPLTGKKVVEIIARKAA